MVPRLWSPEPRTPMATRLSQRNCSWTGLQGKCQIGKRYVRSRFPALPGRMRHCSFTKRGLKEGRYCDTKSCVAILTIATKHFPLTLEFAYAVLNSGVTLNLRRSHVRSTLSCSISSPARCNQDYLLLNVTAANKAADKAAQAAQAAPDSADGIAQIAPDSADVTAPH